MSGDPANDARVRYSDDVRDMSWMKQNVPCQAACPAGTNVPEYIRAIYDRRYVSAYDINREANVLPGILGRVCSRPCEAACRHGWPGNGDPVAICHLKRSSADLRDKGHEADHSEPATGKRVCIVGAGPAGIAIAHDLSLLGHSVVILERETHAGGMLRYGIPAFRLPRDVLDRELADAIRRGVEIRKGVTVGTGPGDVKLSTLAAEYDAVVLATGCMAAMDLPMRGEWDGRDLTHIPGVLYGLDFLMELHRGTNQPIGKRVAVVGAGFTSLDCSRVARRLGAEQVTLHIRTTEDYIPVTPEEIQEAKKEGIRIKGMRTPVGLRLGDDGRLVGIEFAQNRLGGFRAGGRRHAIPIDGSEFIEPCDTLIIGIGQKTVHTLSDAPLDLDKWQNAKVDKSGRTKLAKVFAAGDYVRGASTVIEAIGHAREVGEHVDTFLMGKPRRKRVVRIELIDSPQRDRSFDFIPRQHMPLAVLGERVGSGVLEVEKGYDDPLAVEEAKRCYLCNLRYEIDVSRCIYCRACIEVAPRNCIKLVEGVEKKDDGTYGTLKETKEWNHVRAIWIDNRECIRCGACFEACPVHCISITRNDLVSIPEVST